MKIPEKLIKGIEWLKNNGYTYADDMLDELSILVNKKLTFEENIWSQGAYYKIKQEK